MKWIQQLRAARLRRTSPWRAALADLPAGLEMYWRASAPREDAPAARASLATAQATLRNAEADYSRKAELAQQQLIARGDLDLARATRDQARAQVASAQAQITQQTASTWGRTWSTVARWAASTES